MHARSTRENRPATHGRIASGASTTSIPRLERAGASGSSHRCQVESVHRVPQLLLDVRPGSGGVEVGHGRAEEPPPRGRGRCETMNDEGPARAPGAANIATARRPARGLRRCSRRERANRARKFPEAVRRLCTACARRVHNAVRLRPCVGASRLVSCRAAGRLVVRRVLRAIAARPDLEELQREAHLPAQEAQARPHPRLPRAHATRAGRSCSSAAATRAASGSRSSDAPARPGGAGADRPRGDGRSRRRLSRSAEFERVYRQGRSKANRYLVLYAFPREDAAATTRRPAPRPVGLAPGRRRRRPHAREAGAARGVLAGGRAAARRVGLRGRRAPGARGPRRARGRRRASRARSPSSSTGWAAPRRAEATA